MSFTDTMIATRRNEMKDKYFDDDGDLSSGLAWTLFSLSGEPGYYMLYHDLVKGDENAED